MFLAHYVHDLSPFLVRFGSNFGVRWYGVAYVLAFLCGWLVLRSLAKKGLGQLKPEETGDFITWAALFGVMLGGRIGWILFYGWEQLRQEPLSILRVWDGGMSSHGGILGLVLFTGWYAWRHRVRWTGLGDNLVVAAAPGLFLGRMANFINGELYGRAAQVPWAMYFPAELLEAPPDVQQTAVRLAVQASPGIVGPGPGWDGLQAIVGSHPRPESVNQALEGVLTLRHPSQIYEALGEGLLLFLVLWVVRTRFRPPSGVVTGLFFLLYAVIRIGLEQFREPDAGMIGAFTRGQFLSLFMVLAGLAFLGWGILKGVRDPKGDFVGGQP